MIESNFHDGMADINYRTGDVKSCDVAITHKGGVVRPRRQSRREGSVCCQKSKEEGQKSLDIFPHSKEKTGAKEKGEKAAFKVSIRPLVGRKVHFFPPFYFESWDGSRKEERRKRNWPLLIGLE